MNKTENRKKQSTEQTKRKAEFEAKIIDNSNSKYKILKIDSISDVYMIYALKFEKYYKILSNKSDLTDKNWKRITPNELSNLVLKIEYSQRGIYEHVSGIANGDGQTIYFEGDSITRLYSSPNIKGLYYKSVIEKH